MSLEITGQYRYPPPRKAWLSRTSEEILEPELPILDAHHHMWTQDGNPYLLDELLEDVASGHDVFATVFVEARFGYRPDGEESLRCIGETERVVELATRARDRGVATDICAAIVGHADLRLGDRVEPVLDAHEAAAKGRFRGVRQSVARDPHFPEGIVIRPAREGLLSDVGYRAGLRRVAARGLSYDAMLYHVQIPELTDMARSIPQLRIVLDHFGTILGVGPYRGCEKDVFRSWRRDLADLASCPNVSVKLGGRGMIVCGPRWHEDAEPPGSAALCEAWRPYVETCLELFGTRRCMFESNFPVDKGMFSYPVLWNAYKRLTSGVTADEKADLFHRTASAFYRLKGPPLRREAAPG